MDERPNILYIFTDQQYAGAMSCAGNSDLHTPAKDRIYGYFCLPILHQGHLVGRLDPKLHRREKRMEIKKIYLEPEVEIDHSLVESLRSTLADFSAWHGAKTIEITASDPPDLRKALI